jgi:hypothetical protein
MMKTKLLLTGLAVIAATSLTSAQQRGKCNGQGQGKGNGKCVGRGNGQCNGTGQRQNATANAAGKNGSGKAYNYTDANKNGVCDRYEARAKK